MRRIKFLIAVCGILLLGSGAARATTLRLGLTQPTTSFGDIWGTAVNNNYALIDSGTAVLNQPNVFTDTGTFTKAFNLSYAGASLCLATDANKNVITQQCSAGGGSNPTLAVYQDSVQISSPTNIVKFSGNDFIASLQASATAFITLNPATTDFIHNQASAQTAQFNVSTGTIGVLTATTASISSGTYSNATMSGPTLAYSSGTFLNSLAIGTNTLNGQPFRILDNGNGIVSYESPSATTLSFNLKNNTSGSSPNLVSSILGTGGDSTTGAASGDALIRAANNFYLVNGGAASKSGIIMNSSGVTFNLPSQPTLILNQTSPSSPGGLIQFNNVGAESGKILNNSGAIQVWVSTASGSSTVPRISVDNQQTRVRINPSIAGSEVDFGNGSVMTFVPTSGTSPQLAWSGSLLSVNNAAFSVSTMTLLNVMQDQSGNNILIDNATSGTLFLGANAGNLTVGGASNVGIGQNALSSLTNGPANTALGVGALQFLTGGQHNTAIGWEALELASGNESTAVGHSALDHATTGDENTAVGYTALGSINTGADNVGVGWGALALATTGSSNTAVGYGAGFDFVGSSSVTTGAGNTFIGYEAMPSTSAQLNNATAIGFQATVSSSNTVVLGNSSVTQTILKGNLNSEGASPTLSSCGTSPSIVGSDTAGRITMGTSAPTACTLTFSKSFVNAPFCIAQTTTTVTSSNITSISATSATIGLSTSGTSLNVTYSCIGRD